MTDLERAAQLAAALDRVAAMTPEQRNPAAAPMMTAIRGIWGRYRTEVRDAITDGDGPGALVLVQGAYAAIQGVLVGAAQQARAEDRPLLERLAQAAGAGARGLVDGVNDGLNTLALGAGAGVAVLVVLFLMFSSK